MSKKLTSEEFIEKAKKVHGDKWIYDSVNYVNAITKVGIICKIHGIFYQTPNSHLNGHGCPMCCKTGVKLSSDDFKRKAEIVHGNKWRYDKVEYVNEKTKVCITCPIHGDFWQTPDKHLQGQGCPMCRGKIRKTNEQFSSECRKLYGTKYDYSNVVYVNKNTKVSIICNKCGKEFLMTPHNHLTHKEECPYCRTSKLETSVENILMENSIEYEQQKVFDWLVDGKKIKRFDFYLPKYNVAIECQGLQHFKPVEWFGGEKHFRTQKHNDELKRKLCEEHNIKLLYYSDLKIEYPYEVITDKNKLVESICNNE